MFHTFSVKAQKNRLIILFIALALPARVLASVSFQGLGDLGGGTWFKSSAEGVSADGSVVVGYGDAPSGNEAFRWTSGSGMVGLGELPGGDFFSEAFGVSADGSVVVGGSYSASGKEAFRWTSGGGMVGLGELSGGNFYGEAWGTSADSSVVVGYSNSALGDEAFRWTSSSGMVGLGDLPGGSFNSWAWDVSADGSVVVGSGNSASGDEAFRWTSSSGMVGLGDLPGGGSESWAKGVSADGSVVVGGGSSASGYEAFRWTSGSGMVGLGDLSSGIFSSIAVDVSADGSVVVGDASSGVFLWDETNGMQSLPDVLTNEFGLDLTGWTLTSARAVSDNGLTIVGYGWNPSGNREAWRAVIPEPSTIMLFSIGAIGVLAYVGRRRKWGRQLLYVIGVLAILTAEVAQADVFNMGPGLTSLEMVPVGNPGNAGEWSGESYGGYGPDRICGAVDYVYNIGKYEVTAGQYTEFLNAVASTDTYGLWTPGMFNYEESCHIERSGTSGSYSYNVAADRANRPVTHMSWATPAFTSSPKPSIIVSITISAPSPEMRQWVCHEDRIAACQLCLGGDFCGVDLRLWPQATGDGRGPRQGDF